MKIISCYIENFGCISRQKFDFNDGLTVFCHENGWGKTTLATFLKAMLYGLPAVRGRKESFENERSYYSPWQGGSYGGSLTFSVKEKRYRVERTFGAKESADKFALFDNLTNLPSEDYGPALGEELLGVDADAFERSTYFSERSEYVRADYSDVQRKLVNVDDFERCEKALKLLDDRRKEYSKSGNRGKIGDISARLYAASEELRTASEAARLFDEGQRIEAELTAERQKLLVRQAELSDAIKACTDEKLRQTHAEQANSLRARIAKAEAEYAALTNPPLPDEKALDEAEKRSMRLRRSEEEQASARTQAMVRREIAEADAKRRLAECESTRTAAETSLAEAKTLLSKKKIYPYLTAAAAAIVVAMAILAALMPSPLPFLLLLALAAVCGGLLLRGYIAAKKLVSARESTAKEAGEKVRQSLAAMPDMTEAEPVSDAPALAEDRRALTGFLARFAPDCSITDPDRIPYVLSGLKNRLQSAAALSEDLRAAKEDYNGYLKNHPDLMRQGAVTGDEDALQKEAAECRSRLEAVIEQERLNKQKYTPCYSQAERAPVLEQEIANINETLPLYKHRLEVIQRAAIYLAKAREKLTSGYLDSVQRRFSGYVTAISSLDHELRDRTYCLTPEFEVRVNDGGTTRSDITVSRGTRDLLALCLRLALRDAVFTSEVPPLILDDPFTAYDDHRVRTAVALLRTLSAEQQVIYFVCHTSRT